MKDKPLNRPFESLAQYLKEHGIDLGEKTPIPPDKESDNPGDLLSAAMKDVRTIKNAGKRVMGRPRKPFSAFDREDQTRRLLECAVQEKHRINVTNLPEYMEGFVEGINPLVMEKLRAGEFAVQRILDLHGCSMESADELFQLFIQEAIRDGLKCLKVIHGRGLKSKSGPVLKEGLKRWIVRAMHRKWVLAFCNAVMNDGGPGATYILLKSRGAKEHLRVIG